MSLMAGETVACCFVEGKTSKVNRYAISMQEYMSLMTNDAISLLSIYLTSGLVELTEASSCCHQARDDEYSCYPFGRLHC